MSGEATISLELIGKMLLDVQSEQRAIRVEIGLLGAEQGEIRKEQREIRKEHRDFRTLLLALADQGRRIERRLEDIDRKFIDQRDELELIIKAELMGRLGNFETQIERRLDAIEERMRP